MSRRDSTIKAVAGALQAKSLDLTKFARARAGGIERTRTLSGEQAAGALGFSAVDWRQVDGAGDVVNEGLGNPLTAALLRLKYADQRSGRAFIAAQALLLKRHAEKGDRHRPSVTMHGISTAALFEWVYDACSCRGTKAGAPKVTYCLACGQTREIQEYRDGEGIWRERAVLMGQPSAGCLKCNGLGRMIRASKDPKGMRCAICANSGVKTFSAKQRFRLVNDFIMTAGLKPLEMATFTRRWLKVYVTFVDVLRRADKKLHVAIDTQVSRMENADTVPGREEQIKEPSDESDSDVRQNLHKGRTAL